MTTKAERIAEVNDKYDVVFREMQEEDEVGLIDEAYRQEIAEIEAEE